jgi:RND family efflux transporter MFP subunit
MSQSPEHHDEKVIPDDLPKPGTGKVIVVFVLFLAFLGGLFLVGYVPHQAREKETLADASDRNSTLPIVATARPREQVSSQQIVLPADIRANLETAIYARATGYIGKQYVDINDRVTQGQLLAEIEMPEVDAQLLQSKANLLQAKANLEKAKSDAELARRTLDRYKNLPAAAVSQQDVDQRQAAYDTAVASVAQSSAAIAVADADLQRYTVLQGFEKVYAPFAGTITSRNYDIGALVSPAGGTGAKELFRLVQSDVLKTIVYLPQTYAAEVRIGQPAYLSVRNYPGKEFAGVVSRPAGELSPATRTMPLELLFDNPSGQLYPGMYGQVRLEIKRQAPVLMIPTAALVFDAAGTQVAMVRDGRVHMQKVTVGRDLGTELEITGGLTGADDVVTNPSAQLGEGAAVQAASSAKTVAQETKPKPGSY